MYAIFFPKTNSDKAKINICCLKVNTMFASLTNSDKAKISTVSRLTQFSASLTKLKYLMYQMLMQFSLPKNNSDKAQINIYCLKVNTIFASLTSSDKAKISTVSRFTQFSASLTNSDKAKISTVSARDCGHQQFCLFYI